MTFGSELPPARPRQRDGLAPLDWSRPPSAGDFWPDKLRIEVRGLVQWGAQASFDGYLRSIAPSTYFAARPTVGRQFRADVRFGPAVTGELRIQMTSSGRADERATGNARIALVLNLNPTVARALAVRRNARLYDGIPLERFFKPKATASEAFGEGEFADPKEIALDAANNVLLSIGELGGSSSADRIAARNDFFTLFELKIRELGEAMLSPSCRASPEVAPDTDDFLVTLDWEQLVLRQAELYVERSHSDPVVLVHRLYDRALDLARRIKGQKFWDVPSGGRPMPTTFAMSQDDGYPHLIVPLTGTRNVELSVYAKTNRRVRFEVRYRKKFGHHLRGCSTGSDRLSSLLLRLSENAAKRLPWQALARASSAPPEVNVGDMPDLILHLVGATSGMPNLFRPVVRQILLTGGVIEDEVRYPGIGRAIRRLMREGVLWRWTIQQKEERQCRRYGLTELYAATRRAMLSGFLPRETAWPQPEPEFPADHYEENALLMGGAQWVELPPQA